MSAVSATFGSLDALDRVILAGKKNVHDDDDSSTTSVTESVLSCFSDYSSTKMASIRSNEITLTDSAQCRSSKDCTQLSDLLAGLDLREVIRPVGSKACEIQAIPSFVVDLEDGPDDSRLVKHKLDEDESEEAEFESEEFRSTHKEDNQKKSHLLGSIVNPRCEDFWNLDLDDVLSQGADRSINSVETKPQKTKNKDSKKRSVQFDKVNVRVYERILGVNPSCRDGPSMSIGWRYETRESVSVDDWELFRKPRKPQLIMSTSRRKKIAAMLGYSPEDIAANIRRVAKHRQRRLRTVNNLNAELVEEALETASRRFKKMIFQKQRSSF